jgi:hypothetical protein
VSGPEVLGLLGAVTILLALFEMMRRHRLREKYAVIWFLIAVGALVVAVAPSLLVAVSDALGLQVPSNLVFFVASLVLLGLTLQHSYELGRTEDRLRTLAEEVALLRLRLEEAEGSAPGSPAPSPGGSDPVAGSEAEAEPGAGPTGPADE